MIGRFGLVALALAATTPAIASFRDQSDCRNGVTHPGKDVSDYLQASDRRLVACVNVLKEEEIKNHNDQQELIRMLADQLSRLEAEIQRLKAR